MEDQKKMLVDGEEIDEGSRNTADLANDISPAIKSRSEEIPQSTNDTSETNLSCNEEVEAEEEDEEALAHCRPCRRRTARINNAFAAVVPRRP